MPPGPEGPGYRTTAAKAAFRAYTRRQAATAGLRPPGPEGPGYRTTAAEAAFRAYTRRGVGIPRPPAGG